MREMKKSVSFQQGIFVFASAFSVLCFNPEAIWVYNDQFWTIEIPPQRRRHKVCVNFKFVRVCVCVCVSSVWDG